ncbi:MAG: DNA helicase [Bacteroides sp.]|nr:DNA helicase [Bacteroides sp.]
MENKPLPHSPEAERLVLGTILTQREALDEIRDLLTPETFYVHTHRRIFEAILRITTRGERADLITVMNELKDDPGISPHELAGIAGNFSFDVYQHATLLYEKAQRRRFFEIGHYLVGHCFSEYAEIGDVLTVSIERLKAMCETSRSGISTLDDAMRGVCEQMSRNLMSERELTGHPTGFQEFDHRAGGLQRSDLIVVAGDTSMGKTSLAITLMMNSQAAVAYYSMEMKKEQIAARILSRESGVPASQILYDPLMDLKLVEVDNAIAKLQGKPIYFDDRSTSGIDTILASIRTMKLRYHIEGAVVDYLQILNVNMRGVNKEQQMGDVARRLKNLARELDIWIITLSQLNRDQSNAVPSLHRLRDSGQIAEAADVVMLIYRPEVYNRTYPNPFQDYETVGTAMIDIAKGRNIGLLKFLCGFHKECAYFYEDKKIPRYENPVPLPF